MREGRVMAVGSDADIRKLAGPATRTIDLQGRTVIPGLIDSHMHATRAALELQHGSELDWRRVVGGRIGPPSRAALQAKPGAWLIVVTPPATLDTFKERRRPTTGRTRRRRAE